MSNATSPLLNALVVLVIMAIGVWLVSAIVDDRKLRIIFSVAWLLVVAFRDVWGAAMSLMAWRARAGVLAAVAALGCVPNPGQQADDAVSIATGDTCEQRGKAIIAKAPTCREAVRRLDELVRRDPSCKPFFEGSAGQSCEGDGGAK